MNIFYLIGVVVVVIFVAGYLGVHCPASAPTRQKGRIEIGRIFGPL
jgi:hypothetical protein